MHAWQGQHEWLRLWISYVKPSTLWSDRSGYWENRYELEVRSAVARTGTAAETTASAGGADA